MQKNISSGERMARIVFGIAALSTVFINPRSLWVYLGILLWATGLAGWCPLYALFGISPGKSCKYPETSASSDVDMNLPRKDGK